MRRLVVFGLAFAIVAACSRPFVGRAEPEPVKSDSLYWSALLHLDAFNLNGSTDSAIKQLDAYLAGDTTQRHRAEALVLRRLAQDALHLARVEAALSHQKPDTVKVPVVRAARDSEALREIQRLKEELAKANEELERIKKRLAKPPGG